MVTEKDKDIWIKKVDDRLTHLDNISPDLKDFEGQVDNVNYFMLDFSVFNSLTNDQLRTL